jgi:5,5'-dehydrodivanillate O-demethylase
MNEAHNPRERAERLKLLSQSSRGTLMGTLLRKFWQPFARARDLEAPRAKPVRIMGEDLTLYRGESGSFYLVAGRCAHRGTVLFPGWVEGESIRCVYHGWKYDGTGLCIERPAEKDAARIRITGYPVREYAGLLFTYMGDGAPPEFQLPRKDAFERKEGVTLAMAETWNCNFFQGVENSLDATHVSFVHQLGGPGEFGGAVGAAIPDLSYAETEAGIEQVAVRSQYNVRKSNWTFPNNNHIVVPGIRKGDPWTDVGVWNVPVDDERMTRFAIYASPTTGEAAERFIKYYEDCADYNPAYHHYELFHQAKFPSHPWLINAQDYVATLGQGIIADRSSEILGRSDAGIAFLRKIVFREIEAIEKGRATKQWRRRTAPVDLPTPADA